MCGVPKSLTAGISGEYGREPAGRGSFIDPSSEGVGLVGLMYRTELIDPFRLALPRTLGGLPRGGRRLACGAELMSCCIGVDACRRFSRDR